MATMKEIRNELISLRRSLASQKAGLSNQKTSIDEEWYKYVIKNSDKTREKINKLISMFDAVIG